MLADRFTETFRAEHRQVRDRLLDLIEAFQQRDRERVQRLLHEVAALTGPHFRYEEEALYPLLHEFFTPDYVECLLLAHDGAIGGADRLLAIAARDPLADEDVAEAVKIVRDILPHVSDCDGLSIMVERLSEEKVQRILEARERSLAEGLNLLDWARSIRSRPVAMRS